MNSDKLEKSFQALGWLTMAGIVFSAAVATPARSPFPAQYALLAAGVCYLWELILGHERFFLSRTILGFVLTFLLLNCSHDVWFSGFSVSVAAILFGVFCICFLALVRRRRGGLAVPSPWLFCGLVLLIPMIVAVGLAEDEYAYAKHLAPVMSGQFILCVSAVAVFSGFLAGRWTCAVALLLVAARLALSGVG